MKNFLKISAVVIFAAITTFIVSCDKDDDPVVVQPDNTITAKAVATPDLSILVAALTKTNLATTLQGAGPFTVFAPKNSAFTALNISVESINASTPAEVEGLKQILLNHVVAGNTTSVQLSDNSYLPTSATYGTTTSKLSMYVAKTAAGAVKLNGISNVSIPNVLASNGIIHIVDAVIVLPTIVTHATANPNFSGLVGLLTGSGQPTGASAFTTVLAGVGPFTVFAPTNTAVTNATTGSGFAVGANAATVTKVLQFHVSTAGNVLAGTLTNGFSVPTITTPVQSFTIDLTSPTMPKITDTSATKANIIITDVQCSNGVIHAIDKVLQPTL